MGSKKPKEVSMRTLILTIAFACFFYFAPDARSLPTSETGLEEISDTLNQETPSPVEMCQTLEASDDAVPASSKRESKKDFSFLGMAARETETVITTTARVGYTIAKPPARVIWFVPRQVGKFLF